MRTVLAAAGMAEAADARAWLRRQNSQAGGSTLPWHAAWRSALDALTRCAQHEQWDCPVACITAVSSAAANPIAELNDLSGHHRLPPSFAAEVYDPDMPRVYVLVHDASAPGASTEQLRSAFQQVTQHFPRDVTFPIVVNSRWTAQGEAQEAPPDTALWPEDASVPLLFSPSVPTLVQAAAAEGRACGDQTWPAVGAPLPSKGLWLSHVDVQRLHSVGSDITLRVVLPGWSRKMSALFANVASQKKGIRNALRSWLKRPKDASPRRAAAGGGAAYSPAVYSYGSLETQTRLLADSLAMVGDVNGAAAVYRWAADEYKAAGAGLHYAAASEALALCMLRTGGPSRDADVELENAASLYYSVARDAMGAGRDKLATHAAMTGSTPPALSPFSPAQHVRRALLAPAHLTSPAAAQLGASPAAPSTPARAPGAARGTPQSAAAVQATPPGPPATAAAAAAALGAPELTLAQLLGAAPLPAAHQPDSMEVQRRSAALDISAARMAAKRQAVRRASRVASMAADCILARNSRHMLAASMLRRSGQAEGSRCLSGAVLFEQAALALLAANTANPATMGIGSALATQPLATPQLRKHAFHAVLAAQAYAGNSPPAPYHALRALAASRVSYTPGQCSWPEVDALTIQDMAKSLRAMGDFAAASSMFASALSQTADSAPERMQMDMLHELCAAFMQWAEVQPDTLPAPALLTTGLPVVDTASLQVVSWDNAATAWACLAEIAATPAEGFADSPPDLQAAATSLPWHSSPVHAASLGSHAGPWQGSRAGEGPPRRLRGAGVGASGLKPGAKLPPHLLDDSGCVWPVWSLLRAQLHAGAAPAEGKTGRAAAGRGAGALLSQVTDAAEDAWEGLMEESRASGDGAMQLLAPAAGSSASRATHLQADVAAVHSRGVGQPFAVLVPLVNSLRIPLHLTDVHLISSVGEDAPAAAEGAFDTSALPGGLTWVQQPGCYVSSLSVVLPAKSRCMLPVVVVPSTAGVGVRLTGLTWKLGGVATSSCPLELAGPRLAATAMQRARGMRGEDNRLAFATVPSRGWLAALLEVDAWGDCPSCLAGEVVQGTLHLHNRGTAPLQSLRLAVHGEGAVWAVPTGEGVSTEAGVCGVQHELPVPKGGLQPGDSMQVPVAVRAGGCTGKFRLGLLIQAADGSDTPVAARWGCQLQVEAAASAQLLLKQTQHGSQVVVRVTHASDAGVPHTQLVAVAAPGQEGCSLKQLAQADPAPLMRVRVGGTSTCVFSMQGSQNGADAACVVGQVPGTLEQQTGAASLTVWQQLLHVGAAAQLGERHLAAARLHEHQKRTSAEAADHLPPTLRSIRLAAGGGQSGAAADVGMEDSGVQGLFRSMLQHETHPSTAVGGGCAFWVLFVRWGDRVGMLQCGPLPKLPQAGGAHQELDVLCESKTADAPLMAHPEAACWHRAAYFAPHRALRAASAWPGKVFLGDASSQGGAMPASLHIHSRTTDAACLRRMFSVDIAAPRASVASCLTQEYRGLPSQRLLRPDAASALDALLLNSAPWVNLNNSADMTDARAPSAAELGSAALKVNATATGLSLGKLVALCPITVTLRFNSVPSRRAEAWSDVQAVAPVVLLLPVPQAAHCRVEWLSPSRQALGMLTSGDSVRVQLWAAVICEAEYSAGLTSLVAEITASSVRVKLTPATLHGAPPPVAAVEIGPPADVAVHVKAGR